MKIQLLYSERYFQNWPTWPLIYEWEDIIAEQMNLTLANPAKAAIISIYADKALRLISRSLFNDPRLLIFADKLTSKKTRFFFELLPRSSFYFTGSKHTVPAIIDFSRNIDLNLFYNAYKNCKVVLIANLQAYHYLKSCKCPLNIYHFPQSISDKYRIHSGTVFKKEHDIIIPGRVDSLLWSFLQEYVKKFPGTTYLYRENINGEFFYISNLTGTAYRGQHRDEYMKLLQSSRIAFYSTVGIDGDEERTGGFSPVTPRFLEMISAGCHILARYPQNAETAYFRLSTICRSCDNYSIFENELSAALNKTGPDMNLYAGYLAGHYTSERVKLLNHILNSQR